MELSVAYNCTHEHSHAHQPLIELALPISDVELEKWVKDIYKNSSKAGLHIPSIEAYASKYWDAVKDGYGFDQLNYDTPDADMLQHLADNVYHFSVAKNYTELKSLTGKIVDANGKIRSWSEFKKEASKVTDAFRGSWLEAEYELAVAGGQMASKWQEFERTGSNTLLKYNTVKDNRVSDICRSLEGVIKTIDDAFWNIYYPPNHFRCRCDVDRLVTGSVTTDSKIDLPEIPKMLQTNLGKAKLVFPEGHPYFKGELSSKALYADAFFEKMNEENVLISKIAISPYKKNDSRHLADYQNKTNTAISLGRENKGIAFVLPELTPDNWRYNIYYGKAPIKRKVTDIFWNNEFWEVESYEKKFKKTKLTTMVRTGSKQSPNVIIYLKHNYDLKTIVDHITNEWKTNEKYNSLNKLIVRTTDGKIHYIKKPGSKSGKR